MSTTVLVGYIHNDTLLTLNKWFVRLLSFFFPWQSMKFAFLNYPGLHM